MMMLLAIIVGCSSDNGIGEPLPESGYMAIGFSSRYASFSPTRAAVSTDATVKADGIGVFAMYTKGKKYDPAATDGSAVTTFTDNLMQNLRLRFDDSATSSTYQTWTYGPVRYWPINGGEYVSFTAYAPYRSDIALYAKTASGMSQSGDNASYIRVDVPQDKAKMTDWLRTDASETANMQCYTKDNGSTWTKTGASFTTDEMPRVMLTMKHVMARVGISLSSDALKDEDGVSITVNKVVLLGDEATGDGESPTGAFFPTGYLNLGITTDDSPLWAGRMADGKISITYQGSELVVDGTANNVIKKNGDTVNTLTNAADGYLFIIPQDFTGDDKLFCYIDYTVTDGTGTAANKRGYVQIKQSFAAGQAYTISIDITLD